MAMAADQRKKRLSSANAFGYGSREQHKTKKKHFRPLQFDVDWKFNSHISLQWDDNEKKVVAKEEQVGLLRRHLTSRAASFPCHDNTLADVISVPKDIFELHDLAMVLSYEVWQSILSEKDRKFLMQFLPKGVNPDEMVQSLLSGDNFHFGNPLLKWGSSLCVGDLHPDVVLLEEQTFKANKKAYYTELRNYHENMIKNLQKLKERCASAKDPEREIMRIMSRSRRPPGKNTNLVGAELRSRDLEESVAATSESCSWIAGDKACSSDFQNLFMQKGAEISKSKGSEKGKDEKAVGSSDMMKVISKPKKGEKLQKANINFSDGTKYMSYVKISKAQHELVMSMKQSGNSIQSKALNHVLGSLDNFHVKPYVMFEEEEQNRIFDYWSNLAKNLPSAFADWKKGQSDRLQIMKSLCLEMEEKVKLWAEEEGSERSEDSLHCQEDDELSLNPEDNKGDVHGSTEDDDDFDQLSPENQSLFHNPSVNVNQECTPMDLNEEECNPVNYNEEECNPMNADEEKSNPVDANKAECSPMDLNEEEHDQTVLNEENIHVPFESNDMCSVKSEYHEFSEAGEQSPNVGGCPETHSPIGVESKEVPHSSSRDAWPDIGMLASSCHPTSSMDYASHSDLTHKHPQVIEGHSTRLIDLEPDSPEGNASKNLLHEQQASDLPFFGSYQNHDPTELLHSLIKRDNYHQPELKKPPLEFHPTAHLLMESAQFPGHMRDQLQPSFALEHHRQRGPGDFYMHQNIQESMYPNSSQFSIPRQEQFTPINSRDWSSTSAAQFTAPNHSQLGSGEFLNHNWIPSVENRAQGGWSGSEGSVFTNPSLGSGSAGGDQSLFSVLSQCNSLQPRAAFNAVGPSDRFMPMVNYGEELGGGIPRNSNPLVPNTTSPLDYLSGHDAATAPTFKTNGMGWMNLPHRFA